MAREREGYFRKARSSSRRPSLRGAMMATLLPIWPIAAVLHLLLVQLLLERTLGVRSAARALVALTTSLNILFSSRYHNSDLLTRGQLMHERLAVETYYLRWDFVGISMVLSTTVALWACHLHWANFLAPLAALGFAANALVAWAAFAVFERSESDRGVLIIQATLGLQFLVPFCYSLPLAWATTCGPHVSSVWLTYLLGFFFLGLNIPRDRAAFGAHDVFHVFVVLAHVVSATLDIVAVRTECAPVG
eukprot:2073795-Prymnesium_polylepis.1